MFSAQQGFEIIPDQFDREGMVSVIKSLDQMPLGHGRAGARNALRIESVRELARDSRLINLASGLLGGKAVPFRATLFDKSFRANWLVVWHQDTALPLSERRDAKGWGPWSVKEGVICAHAPAYALEQVLAIRIHLDDSNEQNGSLRVLPQTHTLGVLSDDQTHDCKEGSTRRLSCGRWWSSVDEASSGSFLFESQIRNCSSARAAHRIRGMPVVSR